MAAFATGALLRVLAVPLPGTADVLTWKIWSYSAAHDVLLSVVNVFVFARFGSLMGMSDVPYRNTPEMNSSSRAA